MRENIDDKNEIGVERISSYFLKKGMQRGFIGMPFLNNLFFLLAEIAVYNICEWLCNLK